MYNDVCYQKLKKIHYKTNLLLSGHPCRSWPLGLVPAPGLLWPLSKSASHDFDCHRFAGHRTQRGPSAGTDKFLFFNS